MKTELFDFDLPRSFIAQEPMSPRDHSKLLVYNSYNDQLSHRIFLDLADILVSGDVVVLNRTKVVPARLVFNFDGRLSEVFLLSKISGGDNDHTYSAMVRPGKAFKKGVKFFLSESESCFGLVDEVFEDGTRAICFNSDPFRFGEIPFPPYISAQHVDPNEYQTVYAKEAGSVAAPTAGLHFTPELIATLKNKGVVFVEVLLHVGRGTFLPVKSESIFDHFMHEESYCLTEESAAVLSLAKNEGRRIVAVGTTSVRVLESSFDSVASKFVPSFGETDIFIYPGYKWRAVDALITNFHLPKSTLLMLVSSFLKYKCDIETNKGAISKLLGFYEVAKAEGYRFYSFGDAMFLF